MKKLNFKSGGAWLSVWRVFESAISMFGFKFLKLHSMQLDNPYFYRNPPVFITRGFFIGHDARWNQLALVQRPRILRPFTFIEVNLHTT
jgi:hypothetical protein